MVQQSTVSIKQMKGLSFRFDDPALIIFHGALTLCQMLHYQYFVEPSQPPATRALPAGVVERLIIPAHVLRATFSILSLEILSPPKMVRFWSRLSGESALTSLWLTLISPFTSPRDSNTSKNYLVHRIFSPARFKLLVFLAPFCNQTGRLRWEVPVLLNEWLSNRHSLETWARKLLWLVGAWE